MNCLARSTKLRLKSGFGALFVRGFESSDVTADVLKTKKSHTPFKFIDYAQVEVKGGKGGNGCIAFEVMAPGKKKPQGGSGGMGGNVYMIADKRLTGLSFETFHFNATDGKHGGSSNMTGKNGKDVFIRVPCGVLVTEKLRTSVDMWDEWDEDEEDWDEEAEECEEAEVVGEDHTEDCEEEDYDVEDGMFEEWEEGEEEGEPARSVELNAHNQIILLARGGAGGIGNFATKGAGSNTTQKSRKPTLPGQVVKGTLGEAKTFLLEVKLIADVGLVGYPNAGKSTLLRALSNANPKIANYPFTTLHPNIGVIEYSDKERITVADIPGLVEGAAENRGLGHEFLRHVERTKVLLYVVDISGTGNKGDSRQGHGGGIGGAATERKVDAVADFLTLRRELELYNPELLNKPAIVLANKLDITPRRLVSNRLQRIASRYGVSQVITGSAETGASMGELAVAVRKLIESAPVAVPVPESKEE